jgi:hypothetical protein
MFKTWVVRYFRGGYLCTSGLLRKSEALFFLKTTDAHCIEKIKGLFKGQIIYKHER